MKYVLCDNDDTDIPMITAFPKQLAHVSTRIRVILQVIQYKLTRLTPRAFKINCHALVIMDVQI